MWSELYGSNSRRTLDCADRPVFLREAALRKGRESQFVSLELQTYSIGKSMFSRFKKSNVNIVVGATSQSQKKVTWPRAVFLFFLLYICFLFLKCFFKGCLLMFIGCFPILLFFLLFCLFPTFFCCFFFPNFTFPFDFDFSML